MITKIFRIIRQNIMGFILGLLVMGTGVYAASVIAASNVGYSDNNDLGADNVQDAIDKLNTKATTKISEAKEECPDKMFCKQKLCKRATTLHTEKCTNESTEGYCLADGYKLNDEIMYGNIGTKGTLKVGDAFDCDVNGDGVYDAITERFYYVSMMTNGITTDANTAVLIYYNNVGKGVASSSVTTAYDESGKNNNGPVMAIKQLPTVSQWKNVSLTNPIRPIINASNTNVTPAGNLPTSFSYNGYAARLLTTQELSSGCEIEIGSPVTGELSNKCNFILENTNYSTTGSRYEEWLESPDKDRAEFIWTVYSKHRFISLSYVHSKVDRGVRPVIEVAKSNILY